MIRTRALVTAVLAGLPLCAGAHLRPPDYLEHVKYLSSEQLRGRATGEPGLEKAALYIRDRFHDLNLQPFPNGSYYQSFEVTAGARLGAHNRLVAEGHKLRSGQQWVPLNLSAAGKVDAPVVFAGYGISAPEYNYDDYAGIDTRGKIVLVLRHEPQEFDDHSVFEGRAYTAHAQLASKATNAKMHGAVALLIVNDVPAHPADKDKDKLDQFGETAGPMNAGIEVAQVKFEAAEKWIEQAGHSLQKDEAAIDRDLKPRSFALPAAFRIRMSVDVHRDLKKVNNVGGYVPGESDEYVVIGAHYDHLGMGEQYSMSGPGAIHPGADDNASGTAGVLELARWFSGQPKPKRGILFLAFAGEELGLLGSSYYVNHPEFPLQKAVAMINLDMIGRLRDDKIYIGGIGSGNSFRDLVDKANAPYHFHIDFSDTAGYGSSDHTSFTTKQIPVLFFFSGLHHDYHRPSDTWDKINAPGAIRLLDLVADVAEVLAGSESRPQFVRVVEPHGAHGLASAGAGSGYGPDFGSVPDFTELPNGVRFADIRPGSPAFKAGLKAGDILIEFDGKPIGNLYDFTYALRAHKPGQEVPVKVLRDGQRIEAKVLLTQRR